MKNTQSNSNVQVTQLGKMFVYIALMQLRHATNEKFDLAWSVNMSADAQNNLCEPLMQMGLVNRNAYGEYTITAKGGKLVARYLKACSDELTKAHFGKMKWDKRSKFHKELMARIA